MTVDPEGIAWIRQGLYQGADDNRRVLAVLAFLRG